MSGFARRPPLVAQRVLLAAVLLAGVTCAYTWPLPAYATSAIAPDRGDPLLVTWILWWTSHTIPLTSAWWNAPAFYPSAGVLAFFSTTTVIGTPLDITLSELAIESFFPADEATAAALRAMAASGT